MTWPLLSTFCTSSSIPTPLRLILRNYTARGGIRRLPTSSARYHRIFSKQSKTLKSHLHTSNGYFHNTPPRPVPPVSRRRPHPPHPNPSLPEAAQPSILSRQVAHPLPTSSARHHPTKCCPQFLPILCNLRPPILRTEAGLCNKNLPFIYVI